MPDIQLIKLSIRRGTDEQRQKVVLEQGEIGFTIDHKRLWVGDGVLSGGHVVGAKLHTPIASGKTSLNTAVRGDAVYENSLLYQLTGTDYSSASDWGWIGTKPDMVYTTLNGSNKITLANNSIDNNKFAKSAAYNVGGLVATTNYGLSVAIDNTTIEISNSALQVKNNSITEYKIPTTAFGKGLVGGGGSVIQTSIDPSYFGYIGTTITLSALPTQIVKFLSIDPALVGSGLTYDFTSSTIYATISGVNSTLTNTSGVVGLATITTGENMNWAHVTKDQYGRVTSLVSSLATSLTCNNTTSQVLSTFNGHPGQTILGNPGITLTTLTAASSNGTTFVNITLSSAGFIVIPNTTTRDGKPVGNIAIPVFNV
jgi:hypothetical protein